MPQTGHPIGVDVGGTGMKAAPADLEVGDFAQERVRTPTPEDSTPERIAELVSDLIGNFAGTGPVGITIPGVVRDGVVATAANIDDSWIGCDAAALFSERLGRSVSIVNDADAAGLAEVTFGAAKGARGLVLVTTLGTGIGSAMISDGALVPNSELGHVRLDGLDGPAEQWTSNAARKAEDLSIADWAERLTLYYRHLERLFSPDLIVVGGGISKRSDEFLHLIGIDTPMVPATLLNRAGIIGAALVASA